jgi:plasmid stabilization system protein ParE
MLPINYLPAAVRDFDEAFDWYARRSTIAAERFANAIDASLLDFADRVTRNRRQQFSSTPRMIPLSGRPPTRAIFHASPYRPLQSSV